MVANPPEILKWTILVREAALPAAHKAVLFSLASRANHAGECYPSVPTLMRDAGLETKKWTRKLVGELEDFGWITVTPRPPTEASRQGSNVYRIHPDGGHAVTPEVLKRYRRGMGGTE